MISVTVCPFYDESCPTVRQSQATSASKNSRKVISSSKLMHPSPSETLGLSEPKISITAAADRSLFIKLSYRVVGISLKVGSHLFASELSSYFSPPLINQDACMLHRRNSTNS